MPIKLKIKRKWGKWTLLAFFLATIIYLGMSPLSMPGADEKVNEVAEGYAREVGAGERSPFINTDKGDLILFVFTIGGAVAGFFIGYAWRDIFGKQASTTESIQKG